jgi:hypothetical protein
MYHVKKEGLKGMSADRRADFKRNQENRDEFNEEQRERAERLEGMSYAEKVEDRKREEQAQGLLQSKLSKLYK